MFDNNKENNKMFSKEVERVWKRKTGKEGLW